MATKANKTPLPIEVIFSCQVCYKPIFEIYEDFESDRGFRDDNGSFSEQPVTKLWLADCCHLICGSHLEGGGLEITCIFVYSKSS